MLKKNALPALLVMASLTGVATDAHAEISANVAPQLPPKTIH